MSRMIALTLKEKEHGFVPPVPNIIGQCSTASKHMFNCIIISFLFFFFFKKDSPLNFCYIVMKILS